MAKKKEARGVGRPRSPLTAKLQIRLEPDELEQWRKLAEADDRDGVSDWVRHVVKQAIRDNRW